jgi:hypothetical protein
MNAVENAIRLAYNDGNCPQSAGMDLEYLQRREEPMGMHEKQELQQNVIRELLGIREGEPFFVMRAQDSISTEVYELYVDVARSEGCSEEFIADLENGEKKWRDWQDNNADFVKLPD